MSDKAIKGIADLLDGLSGTRTNSSDANLTGLSIRETNKIGTKK